MDIQARKLILIEEFLRINDERVIARIESFIRQEKIVSHEQNLQPMSMNDFREMIDKAKHESDTGHVVSHQDMKNQVKRWK